MKTKLTKTGFPIFSLPSKKFYIKPHFGQQARNRNKTKQTARKHVNKLDQ